MIHDEADFAEFLENPNREWDYVADELVEEKEELETGITFFCAITFLRQRAACTDSGRIGGSEGKGEGIGFRIFELKMKMCRRRIGRITGRNISSPSLSAKKL